MTLPCFETGTCTGCNETKNKALEFYSHNVRRCKKCLAKKKGKDRAAMFGKIDGRGWKDTMSTFNYGIYGKRAG